MNNQIWAMARWLRAGKFLYASEVPFTPPTLAIQLTAQLNSTLPKIFNNSGIAQILQGNAAGLGL